MKKRFTLWGLAAVLLLCLTSVPALLAQTTITTTTLSAAIDKTQTTFTVASATGFATGSLCYVGNELMYIISVSSTRITVERGYDGTRATGHRASQTIFVGAPERFRKSDPDWDEACVRSSQLYNLWVNAVNGNVWRCDESGRWFGSNPMILAYNSQFTS